MPNTVTFESRDKSPEQYRLRVSGALKKSTARGASADSNDLLEGQTATGAVVGGRDSYEYTGERTEIALSNPSNVNIAVNDKPFIAATKYGEVVAMGDSGGGGGESESTPPKAVSAAPAPTERTQVSTGGGSVSLAVEDPSLGVVSREMATQGDVEMHVGAGRAYESLQAAVNALPYFLLHEVRIHVHGRTKDRNTAHVGPFVMCANVDFIVEGHDNAVINNGGINLLMFAKMDHIEVRDLKTEWISQCKWGRWVNCDLNGNGVAAFSGKDSGKMLIDCDVGGANDDYGVFSIGTESMELRNCTLRGSKAGVKAIGASMHVFTGRNTINAPTKITGGSESVYIGGERVDN